MNDINAILILENVSIQRGEMVLCSGVNLTLKVGDVCHLLGENGLGKTTLLNQIAGLLPTLVGKIDYLDNQSLTALYVSHQAGIHESLTVAQNLRFLMALHGVSLSDDELDNALDVVGLYGYADVKCYELSAGQGRRVGLARLWLTTPTLTPLWILDEPLTALDVVMVDVLQARIEAFAKAGGAVLMTSHQPIQVANQVLDLSLFAVGT